MSCHKKDCFYQMKEYCVHCSMNEDMQDQRLCTNLLWKFCDHHNSFFLVLGTHNRNRHLCCRSSPLYHNFSFGHNPWDHNLFYCDHSLFDQIPFCPDNHIPSCHTPFYHILFGHIRVCHNPFFHAPACNLFYHVHNMDLVCLGHNKDHLCALNFLVNQYHEGHLDHSQADVPHLLYLLNQKDDCLSLVQREEMKNPAQC